MTNVMFDLETFGTTAGSVIRSIGAVVFDPNTGAIGETFYANIDRGSCERAGMTVDPATAKWWASQDEASQSALLIDCRPIGHVANQFDEFFRSNDGDRIWCQGATFDAVLWEAAMKLCRPENASIPWKFWQVRDTRTIYDVADFDPKQVRRNGVHHNALDDCLHQIECLTSAITCMRLPSYMTRTDGYMI